MSGKPLFKAAYPFQDDVLALPVKDLDQALCAVVRPVFRAQ